MTHADEALRGYLSPLIGPIRSRTNELADELNDASPTSLAEVEATVITQFDTSVVRALVRFRPPFGDLLDSPELVFQMFYADLDDPAMSERRDVQFAALLAAHIEARGPQRLTADQTDQLASILTRLGAAFQRQGLYRFAESAYVRAARLYLETENFSARNDCLYLSAAAQHAYRANSWRRRLDTVSALLVGYRGHRPFRLLGWMAAQLTVIYVTFMAIPGSRESWTDTLYITLQNFINPAGISDTVPMPHGELIVLVIESYLGTVSLTVFFVLLVRKWLQ
jgi:hypothetical protein